MRKLTLLLLGMVLFVGAAFAQRTISGVVADEKGNPLPNVSVVVRGSTTGTSTKTDGSFSLSVPANATALVFSSVGMVPKEVALTSVSTYTVRLEATGGDLSEVVVVGYGSARKKSEVVGSVVTVSATKVQERPSANAFDALQGKVAGLQVFTSSGEPSATSSVRIHGVGSLSSSSTPLYVMDGIPIDPGTVVSLNPEDFETISVLKDASATSIYGARAANGVIYITTKKGSVNTTNIAAQFMYGSTSLIGTTEDMYNGFMNSKQLTDFWLAVGYQTQAQVNNLLAGGHDTKWYKTYYADNAPLYQANLSVSGGGGKTTYYLSGSYFKSDGLAYRSAFDRFTVRSNINSAPTKWMNIGINVFGGHDRRQTNQYGSNNTNRGLALLAQPFFTPNDPVTGKAYEFIPGLGRYHPNYLQDKMPSQSGNLQINPSGYVQITPIKNLTLKSTAGFELYDFRTTSLRYPSYLGSLNVGSVTENYQRGMTRNINNTIEYNFKVKSLHSISLLAGQEWIDFKFDDFTALSTGQTDDRLMLLTHGSTTRDIGNSKAEYAFLSYFGRVGYNFDSKYFLDATIRQDQSSRFGQDNRNATFWSVGAMWNMKKESFLSNVKWLTDAVLKVSVGTSGNSAIGNYESQALVGTNQYEATSGWGVSSPGNSELSWESQRQINIGTKFTLFNRGHFEIDVYDRRTTNMLVSVPYPLTSGFGTIRDNVGELQNSGIDVMIDWDIVRTRDAYITPTINFNYNKNKVVELFQDRNFWSITNTGVGWIVGQPVSFIYPMFSGINPQTGNPEWYLPTPGDITVPTRDKGVTTNFVTANLQQNTGIKRFPPFTGGFGLNAGYKGFYFNTDFAFAQGKYLINNDRYFFENPTAFPGFNQSLTVLDYWKQPGDNARFPRINYAVAGGLVQFTQFDDRLIEDASFLRIKNMTVGYVVPKKIVDRTGFLKGAKFYITGRNLVTWTKYTGPDPEVDSNLTLGVNPNTKQVSVGIDLNF